MAIVLPHGVLFRGNTEGKIRKILLDNGAIDTVIGLPANIFFNTSIPTTVIILKKNRSTRDVLFIDASNEFEKGKNQNVLTDDHIDKILEAYIQREDVEKYAHVAPFDEVVENDYNLNIPRYVDTFEEEEEISLVELSGTMQQTQQKLQQVEQNLFAMLNELEGTNEDAQQELQRFIQTLGGGKNE
ncbi:Type I restriction-modification system methylation subunit [Streptococcus pneumoniae]|nr:Type I restriction-modification system methylation subunit [Streptococcus pneumoniae]